MNSKDDENNSIYKLSQVYKALSEFFLDFKYLKPIVDKAGDINYAVPTSNYLPSNTPELIGNTILHFAVSQDKIKLFEYLLNLGADFMMKNQNGMDPLHLAIQSSINHRISRWKCNNTLNNQFIDIILGKQILSDNIENPRDNNGISHFHAACMTNNVQAVEYFLKNGVSVDEATNQDFSQFPGYTPLHIAFKCNNIETAEILLKYGAEITLKDSKGMTALHLLLEQNMDIMTPQKDELSWGYHKPMTYNTEKNDKIISLVLETRNRDIVQDTGLTRLHVACATKNSALVENLLKTDYEDINCKNLSFRPDYTPLHFAAHFNLEAVKLLLKHGANVGLKDAKGLTPFEICLKNHAEINGTDIHFIMSHHPIWKDASLTDNTTKLIDLVSAMQSPKHFSLFIQDSMKNNINAQIRSDSDLWPGCTALHLAMILNKNIVSEKTTVRSMRCEENENCSDVIKVCLELGADLTTQNSQGDTPLHHAFKLGKIDVVKLLCEHHEKLINPIDMNGLSHLHIACAVECFDLVQKLLSKNDVDVNHQIVSTVKWPIKEILHVHAESLMHYLPTGTTALHIAVAIGSWKMIKILLDHGADVYAKDDYGMTPMHWILISFKSKDVKQLFSSVPNLIDCVSDNGLSLLHVASLVNGVTTVKHLLDAGSNINAKVRYESQKDRNFDDLLSFLSKFSNFTALHFAIEFASIDVIKLLVKYEADIIAKYTDRYNGNIITPLYHAMSTRYVKYEAYRGDFISMLKGSCHLQKRVKDETGFTMFHLACWEIDCNAIKNMLDNGETNVNARLHYNSPMWPGYTPMHLLMRAAFENYSYNDQFQRDIDRMIQLILDYDADVMLSNAKNEDLIHFVFKKLRKFDRNYIIPDSVYRRRLDVLLDRLENFIVNPVNNFGTSHFHIACYLNNSKVIKKFLEHQVDVNQPIDHFSDKFAGYTSLHMALYGQSKKAHGLLNQLDIVEMLIKHGAQINAEDSFGNTPFHIAAQSGPPRREIFQLLLSHGADIFAKNILGKTPFQVLLESKTSTINEIQFFLESGINPNTFNSISEKGSIALALRPNENDDKDDKSVATKRRKFEVMVNPNPLSIDELGRGVIHNIVSERMGSYRDTALADVVEKLKSLGCDIDLQDRLGRTALHTTARFRNWYAVSGLLLAGLDVNITDTTGQTAFDYALNPSTLEENERERNDGKVITMRAFAVHIHKLLLRNLEVNQSNKLAFNKAIGTHYFGFNVDEINKDFNKDVEKTKKVKIGMSLLTLYDFLSETGAVSAYPYMTHVQKNDVRQFFEVEKRYKLHHELQQVAGLLKLQYKKAIVRVELVELAKEALLDLIRYPLPHLCSIDILKYLSNAELQNLIASVT